MSRTISECIGTWDELWELKKVCRFSERQEEWINCGNWFITSFCDENSVINRQIEHFCYFIFHQNNDINDNLVVLCKEWGEMLYKVANICFIHYS